MEFSVEPALCRLANVFGVIMRPSPQPEYIRPRAGSMLPFTHQLFERITPRAFPYISAPIIAKGGSWDGLITISGNVRHTAALLKVLILDENEIALRKSTAVRRLPHNLTVRRTQ